MKNEKKKPLLRLSITSLIFTVIACGLVVFLYFFFLRRPYFLDVFIPAVIFFISLSFVYAIVTFILWLVFQKKDKDNTFHKPARIISIMTLCVLVVTGGICGIDYAFTNKAYFGVPDEYIVKLDYYSFVNGSADYISFNDGSGAKDGYDTSGLVQDALKELKVNGPKKTVNHPKAESTFSYGRSHSSLTFCSTGYAYIFVYGGTLNKSYSAYYEFDVSQYQKLYDLVVQEVTDDPKI